MATNQFAAELQNEWTTNPRWKGITRPYTAEDVDRLRGTIRIDYSLARLGAERLWELLKKETYIQALGALTGNQAVQMVKAGLQAIYLSGWQVAGDANDAGQMYPDQSLYPANSVPTVIRRINNALIRADQIHHSEGKNGIHFLAPIVADAEAGFGGNLNAFELMKAMIEAGAACVHFEDQLSSAKKCGHLGGKVLVPTHEAVQKLVAARLAADICGVPSLILARTDANSAHLLTSDIDPYDHQFLTGERTNEGFFGIRGGLDSAIARGLAYAPYADLIWCETSEPNMEEAKRFADAIHAKFPGKMLAYNCSPSFNWKKKLGRRHRALPTGAGGDGLQVPVHHAGRFPRSQPEHVRAGEGLQAVGHDGLLRAAGEGVCLGEGRLRGGEAPALRGHRLFRPGAERGDEWQGIHQGSRPFDRGGAVRSGRAGEAGSARRRCHPWPTIKQEL